MSSQASISILNSSKVDTEARHRFLLRAGYTLAVVVVLGLLVHGFDYYFLELPLRPFSPKHTILKPTGSIGLWLGILGAAIFMGIFLYPIRKRWDWLRRQGNSRHWLDFHVLMGLTAPFVIAFHASFKFHGLAGMAFWIMTAVALSGVVGRYLYGQIPRSLNAAELSLKDAHDLSTQLAVRLTGQKVIPAAVLAPMLRLPSEKEVKSKSIVRALCSMVTVDIERSFSIARVRRHACGVWGVFATLGGFLATTNAELERVIDLARKQASLSKRILFLSRSQQVFHLWHVVHKPFSYSFAVLAGIHILVAMLFGVR